MKNLCKILFYILFLLGTTYSSAQEVIVEGKLKVTAMDTLVGTEGIVVRDSSGVLGVRKLSTLGIVSSDSMHYVGEIFGGGIVFFTYDNGRHGLIASLSDLYVGLQDNGDGLSWTENWDTLAGSFSNYDGMTNTQLIVDISGENEINPATLCNNYVYDGFDDWYLPSIRELKQMDNVILALNIVLSNDGNPLSNPIHDLETGYAKGNYWSSTEYEAKNSWYFNFTHSFFYYTPKLVPHRVRAVRKF